MKIFIENLIVVLVVFAQILSVVYIIGFFVKRKNPNSEFVKILGDNGFKLTFLVALISTCGSLFYSDVLGYEPCKFCWFQRIFMYPQALILGLALWRKEWNLYFYSIVMSVIGGLIALNHYILQMTGSSIIPCSAVGQSVSCSKVFVVHLGYITIPFMALSGFVLMTLAMVFYKQTYEITR
ncbi:MAG: thiol-disulfide oxidoreductase-like protein [Candidatus Taylorbacteria bacterium]|nr:thiol-disulfide oxidoreductase-like protein [Candidatus Taylorbacteria bacterium]